MVRSAQIPSQRRGLQFNWRRTQVGASRNDTDRGQIGDLTEYVVDTRMLSPDA